MKYFEDFARSGESFELRDQPSSLCSAVGRAAIARASLSKRVERAIRDLAEKEHNLPSPLDGYCLLRKSTMLSELITKLRVRRRFNAGELDADELSAELIEVLKAADALYRRTVEPNLAGLHLREQVPADLPALIMDVADYLMYSETLVDDFFLVSDPVV